MKGSAKEEFDKYIVVSFTNATIVLSIGDTVEEVTDSGFLATAATLSVSLLGDDSLLQVCLCVSVSLCLCNALEEVTDRGILAIAA